VTLFPASSISSPVTAPWTRLAPKFWACSINVVVSLNGLTWWWDDRDKNQLDSMVGVGWMFVCQAKTWCARQYYAAWWNHVFRHVHDP